MAGVSFIAPTLEAFFTVRLLEQRRASPHTVASYRDTFRLLFGFVQRRCGKAPSQLDFVDLEAAIIGAFLADLETTRQNSAVTRNVRLAAIHSFFKFADTRHPEHAQLIQAVLAIPVKRTQRALVSFLDRPEIEALLAAPSRATFIGRRDHMLLLFAVQAGLRLSELAGLTRQDLHLGTGPHVRCLGKGRRERVTPLTSATVAALKVWLAELKPGPTELLFPSRQGGQLSPDAIQLLVAKHTATAARSCPSLGAKHVTPHSLRHTTAMQLLKGGVDTSVIALWLGHQSPTTTQIYVHADMALKQRALARAAPPDSRPGRYRPPDRLMAFLTGLG